MKQDCWPDNDVTNFLWLSAQGTADVDAAWSAALIEPRKYLWKSGQSFQTTKLPVYVGFGLLSMQTLQDTTITSQLLNKARIRWQQGVWRESS